MNALSENEIKNIFYCHFTWRFLKNSTDDIIFSLYFSIFLHSRFFVYFSSWFWVLFDFVFLLLFYSMFQKTLLSLSFLNIKTKWKSLCLWRQNFYIFFRLTLLCCWKVEKRQDKVSFTLILFYSFPPFLYFFFCSRCVSILINFSSNCWVCWTKHSNWQTI